MLDISNKSVLEQYLLDRGIIRSGEEFSYNYCQGGVSCTVVFIYAGNTQLILKQGLAKLKVKEEWLCDPNRMYIEQESNRIYHSLVPDCAPEVFFYDEENFIYGREAVPVDWSLWKTDLLNGVLNFRAAEKVITTLLTVHKSCSNDAEVRLNFDNKDIFYNLRISPYFEFVKKKHDTLSVQIDEVIDFLMSSKITLVHGDFSPKNIMVKGDAISILDYEVAHFGHPAFDLGFFSTHFVLKAIKNKQWAESYLNMLNFMMNVYFKDVRYMDKKLLELCYVKTWALIILARVDGKSPAEYITEESDKELVRTVAMKAIKGNMSKYSEVISMAQKIIIEAR